MQKKKCPTCGTEFEGRVNKIYCSHRCKMAAFYGSMDFNPNPLTVNQSTEKLFTNPLMVNNSEGNPFNGKEMETVQVAYTTAEKQMLEQHAIECETVLPKLIRIRSLMEETDIRQMQSTLSQQKDKIEELRSKLGFYQNGINKKQNVEPFTDKPFTGGLIIEMSEKQQAFLLEKYKESYDFEASMEEPLPDGSISSNQNDIFEANEKKTPGYTLFFLKNEMLCCLLKKIQNRLIEHCGYAEEEFEDGDLVDEFDGI